MAAKSSTPKALTLTSVTLSDQTAVVFVVPQRSRREVLGQQRLRLLIQGIGLVRVRRRGRLGLQLVELRVVYRPQFEPGGQAPLA